MTFLTHYRRPYRGIGELHSEINRLFDSFGRYHGTEDNAVATADWSPAVDVREEDNRYVLRADLPGVDSKDIDITMEDGSLTIRGSRETSKEEEGEGFRRVERVSGSFYRRFTLPDTADAENISAESKNGVLEIVIPKQPKVQPKRINVKF
ncbi:MAG: Hsp20/alpha crystallin family protein [Gammaproteobacteria bacterium]|nr:Hsp20/alpha crystallin family protein [Gammaproteobacteria bacterium]